MPELPDLTVFAENLHRRLSGRRVRSIIAEAGSRLNVSAAELSAAVVGREVEKVERSGKEIDIVFTPDARLRIHLMLAGRFRLTETPERIDSRIAVMAFAAGPALVVSDPKRLARLTLNPLPTSVPDALEVDTVYLRRRAAEKPKTAAKAFLVDQAIVRGIGNAYADEILWTARIAPRAAVGRIPPEAMANLSAAMSTVLQGAIEAIRAAAPDIIGGELRDFLAIHHPQRSVSPTGHPIRREKIASKLTYFTDEQILY